MKNGRALPVTAVYSIHRFLFQHGRECVGGLYRGDDDVMELFELWCRQNPHITLNTRRVDHNFVPIDLNEAAMATGKSLRALQQACKKRKLKANWVNGRWWTTLADLSEYMSWYGRSARGSKSV